MNPTLGTTAGDSTSSSSSLAASATALARGLRLAAAGAAALSAGPAALLAAGFLAAGALRVEHFQSGLHKVQGVQGLQAGNMCPGCLSFTNNTHYKASLFVPSAQ